MRLDDGCTWLRADQWCYLRFRFATAPRSTVLGRLCPARAGTSCGSAHYESVDERFQWVHSRPDEDGMSAWDGAGPGVNRMQLQPCVQPLGLDLDLAEHTARGSIWQYMTNAYYAILHYRDPEEPRSSD
jgi:hypothetical protein